MYVLVYILYIGCNVAIDLLMASMVNTGSLDLLGTYIVLTLGYRALLYTTKAIERHVELHMKRSFIKNVYEMYDLMTFESKNKTSAQDFRTKSHDAKFSITSIITWGIPTIIETGTTILTFILVLCSLHQYSLAFLVLSLNCASVYFLILPIQAKIGEFRKTIRKRVQRFLSILRAKLEQFQNKNKTVEDMIQTEYEMIDTTCEVYWNYITTIVGVTNALPLIYCYYCISDVKQLLLIIQFSGHLKSVVSGMTGFMNNYSRLDSEYNSDYEMWSNAKFGERPSNEELPNQLVIKSVLVERKSFKLQMSPSLPEIAIKQGDKILIQGKSGHGKSTFLNAFTGKLENAAQLNVFKPENFYHTVSEFYQGLVGNLPTIDVTVRFLFDDEKKDDIITMCLDLACASDILAGLKKADLKGKKADLKDKKADLKDKKTNSTDLHEQEFALIDILGNEPFIEKKENDDDDIQSKLDIDINQALSGGQKARLAVAIRIYYMLKHGKQILILDEFDHGSDADVAYQIVENLFKAFPNKTLIFVSHLELISIVQKWDTILNIQDGIISLGNPNYDILKRLQQFTSL
jgi:ABC-type bacteriocin/lantibiotic exporter with double-glycine peptidase domain